MTRADPFDTVMMARTPLVLGIGGGGDVVGAYALAELLRRYRNAQPIVGGVSWERLPLDPQPGPRRAAEIERAREIAPGVLLATGDTKVRGSGVRFSESKLSEFVGEEVLLVELEGGPVGIADGLAQAMSLLHRDALVMLDVGGDVLALGDEPGLGSPLTDSILLAAGADLAARGTPVVGAVFGAGCDGELTPAEVATRVSELGTAGALSGALGLTRDVAAKLEGAAAYVQTEASALPIEALHGRAGTIPIRGGRRQVQLTPAAALTVFFDVELALAQTVPLARAVQGTRSLEEANDALRAMGVRTELDYECETVAARA
jgi:hypothetical protein